MVTREHPKILDMLRADSVRYLQATVEVRKLFLGPLPAAKGEMQNTFSELWIGHIESTSREHQPVLASWHALTELPTGQFTDESTTVLDRLSDAVMVQAPFNACIVEGLASTNSLLDE